ncbi:MAG: YraN family protein [Oscillospiraceae bacterium]|nr:YraN family protein [Oscillospiraceae bacterium]
MNTARLTGGWGEAAALEFLKKRGYEAVGMGYRTRFGEIDIIARDGRYIVFVEVQLRKDKAFAEAREFVSPAKQRRVRTTAQIWLTSHETELQPRFDVIEIYAPEGVKTRNPEIIHLEDAF